MCRYAKATENENENVKKREKGMSCTYLVCTEQYRGVKRLWEGVSKGVGEEEGVRLTQGRASGSAP